MPIAFNSTTGEAVLWDGKAWVPTKTATNSETGESVAWDGFSWEKIKIPEQPSGLLPALSSGTDILQNNLYSALEGGAKGVGLDSLAQWAGKGAARNKEEASAALPNPQSFTDANSLGDYWTAAKEALGTSLPSMAPMAAGAAAGAGIGTLIMPGFGTTAGGIIGGTLGGIPGFYGSNRESQKDANQGVVKSEGAALLTAVPQAVMDSVLQLVFPGLGKAVTGGLLTRMVKKGAEGIIEEVPTEIGQQILERYQAGKPIADEEAIREYKEVAKAAGVLGGGLGGVGGALQGRIQEPQPEPQTPADLAEHIANVRANMPGGTGGISANPAGGPSGGPPGLPSPNAPAGLLPPPSAPAGLLPPPDAGPPGLTGPQPQPQLPPPSGLAGLLPPPPIRLPPPSEGVDGIGGPPPTQPIEPPSSGGAGEFFQPPTDDLIERLAQPETGANALEADRQAAEIAAQAQKNAEVAQQQAPSFDLPPQPQAAPEVAQQPVEEPQAVAPVSDADKAREVYRNLTQDPKASPEAVQFFQNYHDKIAQNPSIIQNDPVAGGYKIGDRVSIKNNPDEDHYVVETFDEDGNQGVITASPQAVGREQWFPDEIEPYKAPAEPEAAQQPTAYPQAEPETTPSQAPSDQNLMNSRVPADIVETFRRLGLKQNRKVQVDPAFTKAYKSIEGSVPMGPMALSRVVGEMVNNGHWSVKLGPKNTVHVASTTEPAAAPQATPASERNAQIERHIAKTLLDMGLDGKVSGGGAKYTSKINVPTLLKNYNERAEHKLTPKEIRQSLNKMVAEDHPAVGTHGSGDGYAAKPSIRDFVEGANAPEAAPEDRSQTSNDGGMEALQNRLFGMFVRTMRELGLKAGEEVSPNSAFKKVYNSFEDSVPMSDSAMEMMFGRWRESGDPAINPKGQYKTLVAPSNEAPPAGKFTAENVVNNKPPELGTRVQDHLVFMSCSKKKKEKAIDSAKTHAVDIYDGPFFQQFRKAAENRQYAPEVLIVSAKHGIITGGEVIEPYDEIISDEKADEIIKNMDNVVAKIKDKIERMKPYKQFSWDIKHVLISGSAAYKRVMRATIARLKNEGLIDPDAGVMETTGDLLDQRKQFGEYLKSAFNSDKAAPAEEVAGPERVNLKNVPGYEDGGYNQYDWIVEEVDGDINDLDADILDRFRFNAPKEALDYARKLGSDANARVGVLRTTFATDGDGAGFDAVVDENYAYIKDGELETFDDGKTITKSARSKLDKALAEQPAAPKYKAPVKYKEVKVKIPTGGSINTQYEIVELDSLKQATGELQNRDRDDNVNYEAILQEMYRKFDPTDLEEDKNSDRGAPIVGDDDIIDSGNGRALLLGKVYNGKDDAAIERQDAYKGFLEEQGYDTEGFKKPVLIRRRLTELTPEKRRDFVVGSNKDKKAALKATEQAKETASYMKRNGSIGKYFGGNLNSEANSGFVQDFMKSVPVMDRGTYMTGDGEISAPGKKLIKSAIEALAYEDDALINTLLDEEGENDIKALGNVLEELAGRWAKFRQGIADKDIRPELEVTKQFVDAVKAVRDIRARKNWNLKDYLSQRDMFSEKDPVTVAFLKMFHAPNTDKETGNYKAASQKSMMDSVGRFISIASEQKVNPGFFDDKVELSPLEIIQQINDERLNKNDQGNMFASVLGDANASALNASLPKKLTGAKPRYGFGKKNFPLAFDSDFSKALYIAYRKQNPYREWLIDQGVADGAIDIMGKLQRDNIKQIARDMPSGETLRVEDDFSIKPPEKAPKASPKGKKSANAPKADFEEEIAPTAGKRQAEAAAAPQPIDPERLKQSRAIVKKFLQDMIARGDNNAAQSALKAMKDRKLSDTEVHHYLLAMDITSRILGPTKVKPAYLFTNLALNHPQAGPAAAMAIPPGRSQKYMEGLMIFSLEPGSRKRIQMNAFHEAFHILQGLMQAHDPKTTQIINKAFKSGMTPDDVDPSIKRALQSATHSEGMSYWDFFKGKYDTNPALRSEFKKDYEASAYMFGLLAEAKQNGQNLNALMPAFKRFLNFIEQFKQRMGNALSGLGYRSVEDVFNDYAAGRQQQGYDISRNAITGGGARASLLGAKPDEKELERRKDRAREISNAFWNKDAAQAAEWLANNTKPEYQPIARKVADRLKLMKRAGLKTTVTVLERGDKPKLGGAVAHVEVMFGRRMDANNSSGPVANVVYRGLTDDTTTRKMPPLSDEIALHELIHAAIHGSIGLARRSPKDLAPNLHEAVKDLNDLRNFVVSRYNDRFRQAKAGKLTLLPIEEKFDKWNTLNDEDEFVAWGMTSPEFQKYLDDLPTPSGLKTRFDDFVNAIRKLLGFAPGQETSLSKLIQISADMLGVSIDELRAVGNARNARVVSEDETYEERTDQPMASVLMGDAPVSPGTAEVEAVEKVKRGKAPVFKGTIKLLHGSENPDKKSFTKNYTGDRYEGGESEFGSDSVVYLDNTGKWTGGEYRGFSARNVYEVEANFKNAYVISPETLDDLFSILPDRTQEAERLRGIWKKYNDQPDGPNSKEPGEIDPAFESLQRKIISPEDIAKVLRKMGHDGIIVQGFDQFTEDYQSRNRSGSTPIDRAVNRGIYETTFQDQVVSFSPEDIRVVRRIEDYKENRKAYAKPVRAPVSMASVLMDDESAHAPEIREGVATVMQGAATAARSAVGNWQKVKLVAKSVFDPLAKLPNTVDYLIMRYRLVGRIDELEREAKGFHDRMKKATKEQSMAIFEYLTTRGAAVPNLPPDLRDVAITVKQRIKDIGRELSDPSIGILSPQSVAMYEDMYLPRLYMKYLLEEKGFISTGPRMGMMQYAKGRTDVDEETRVALGEVKDPGFASFAALYRPQRDMAVMKFLKGIAEASDKDWVYPNQLIEWKGTRVTAFWLADEANNIRERMLFEKDPANKAVMARVADQMQRLAVDNIGDIPSKGYKRLPKSNRYGALKGLAVREEIYNDLISLSGFDPDPNLIDKIFGDKNSALAKGTQFWKMAKTILNPPTQIRQIISNAVMLNLSGVPLHRVTQRMLQAMDAIKNDSDVWKKAKEYGIQGGGFNENELREATNLLREYLADNSTGIMNPKKLMNIVAKITDKAGAFYQYTDQVFKVAKIIDEVERKGIRRMPNGDAKERAYAEAVLQGHKWFFDYSLVHRGIKSLRTMPFGAPFITYYYKALPLMVEVAMNPRTAMRFAPYVALMATMPALVASMYDVDDDDVEKLKLALSEKLREKPNMIVFPFKDQNGNWQFLDWGYFFPWAMFVDTGIAVAKGDVVGALGTVGALTSPALSLASAIKTNVDPFTGREIINQYDPPNEKMKSFLSYVNSLLMPPIVTSYGAFGKAIEAATNSGVNRYGEPNMDAIQITARAMGFNFYPVVPELQRARNIKRMDYEIQMVRSNLTHNMKDRSLTPEKRAALREEFNAELKRRREARNKYIQDSALPVEFSRRAKE